MKGIFKFMTAVLAVGALVSCTDELVDSPKLQAQKGDLIGHLNVTEDKGVETRVAYEPGFGYVWDDEDAVRVYTLSGLTYNSYKLTDGEGTQSAVFTKTGGSVTPDGEMYAVTEHAGSGTIYGISATADGNAMLTATIPARFDWSDVILTEDGVVNAYKMPAPFWGLVTNFEEAAEGQAIDVQFKALTSFIKLDLATVPVATQAIVLTTHEDYYTGAAKPYGLVHRGGDNEPLAGTMNAVLNPDEPSALQADPRLASHDTIRIDFDKVQQIAGENKILYIPVPAQHYTKLDVLAITTDNRAPYTWNVVDLLKSYVDEDFVPGKTYAIYQTNQVIIPFTVTSPKEVSEYIAQQYDGIHDVRVLVTGALQPTPDDDELLIVNNAQASGLEYSNVEITFAQQPTGTLYIDECPGSFTVDLAGNVNFGGFKVASPDHRFFDFDKKNSMPAKQTVTLNFEAGNDQDLYVVCPESNIIFSADDVVNGEINVVASTTNDISGYEDSPKNKKNAAITIKGGVKYADFEVWAPKNSVYAYGEDTEIIYLNMRDNQPGSIRLTDALVSTIDFKYSGVDGTVGSPIIVTTGSAAIKNIKNTDNKVKVHAYWTGKALTDYAVSAGYEGAEVKDDDAKGGPVASGVIYTAAQLQAIGLDKGLELGGSMFASGNGVLNYYISKKVGYIWLGGEEFPWLGAQMGVMKGDQVIDGVLTTNRELVDPDFTIWDSYNAQKYADEVVVDCNWVDLHNMEMTINDILFQDPHRCCTSCGEQVVKVQQDLGLIRCINSKSTVDVKNVRLNDVELVCMNPKINIPNVGSIVGRITADDNVTLQDNRATNIQLAIAGGNVGGHVGNLISTKGTEVKIIDALSGLYSYDLKNSKNNPDTYTFENTQNYAETDVYANFVSTIGDNAGGLIGILTAPKAKVTMDKGADGTGVAVGMSLVVVFDGSNAGGLIGRMNYGAADSKIKSAKVTVDDIVALENSKHRPFGATLTVGRYMYDENFWGNTGDNVGGFVGYAYAAQKYASETNYAVRKAFGLTLDIAGTSTTNYIFAGGRYAGGIIGHNLQAEGSGTTDAETDYANTKVNGTTVKINKGLYAINSCAGGIVGQEEMGDLYIGNSSSVTVEIEKLATAFAGGGLVGQNLDDVFVRGTATAAAAGTVNVTAKVKAWENTWATMAGEEFFKNNWGTHAYCGETESALRMFCGSFDNLIGLMSEHSYIWNANITTNGLIPNKTKTALLFKLHTDATNTKGVPTDPYWGDQIGYVGYADQSSFYLLNGSNHRQADQEFNYRNAAIYGED